MRVAAEAGRGHGSERPSIAVGMLGARDHYAIPKILHGAGMLETLFTDAYLSPDHRVGRFLSALPGAVRPRSLERLLGRGDACLPPNRVKSFPSVAMKFWLAQRLATDTAQRTRAADTAMKHLNRRIVAAGFPRADAVLGYRGGSVELFEYARPRQISCILNQSGVAREVELALLRRELARWPGWEPGLTAPANDRLREREAREWEMADRILVASEFTRAAVASSGGPAERCCVVPLGVDLDAFTPGPPAPPSSGGLRVLFAGQVRLQKGIPYLLEALRSIDSPKLEVRIAGQVQLDRARLRPYEKYAAFLGAVPRSRMLDLFRWADLFVFPSVCDGFGLAVYEAMACGLPVVITDGAGAEVRPGIDGLVVAAGDAAGLAAAIETFLLRPEFRIACRSATLADRQRLGMQRYGQRLVGALTGGVVTH